MGEGRALRILSGGAGWGWGQDVRRMPGVWACSGRGSTAPGRLAPHAELQALNLGRLPAAYGFMWDEIRMRLRDLGQVTSTLWVSVLRGWSCDFCPQGTFGNVQEHFGCHSWVRVEASSEWRTAMLLNNSAMHETDPTAQNYLVPNASSAKAFSSYFPCSSDMPGTLLGHMVLQVFS